MAHETNLLDCPRDIIAYICRIQRTLPEEVTLISGATFLWEKAIHPVKNGVAILCTCKRIRDIYMEYVCRPSDMLQIYGSVIGRWYPYKNLACGLVHALMHGHIDYFMKHKRGWSHNMLAMKSNHANTREQLRNSSTLLLHAVKYGTVKGIECMLAILEFDSLDLNGHLLYDCKNGEIMQAVLSSLPPDVDLRHMRDVPGWNHQTIIDYLLARYHTLYGNDTKRYEDMLQTLIQHAYGDNPAYLRPEWRIEFTTRHIEMAIKQGYVNVALRLIKLSPYDSNLRLNTELYHLACGGSYNTIIEELLKHDYVDPSYDNNACLRAAAHGGKVSIVRLLLTSDSVQNGSPVLLHGEHARMTKTGMLLSLAFRDSMGFPGK